MESYKKLGSEIRSEALQKLKGKFMIFGLVSILIGIVQAILNNIPYLSIFVSPFFAYLLVNVSLLVIDSKELSAESIVKFKGRSLQILIGGLILNFMGSFIAIVINIPIFMSIGFNKIFRLFMQTNYRIDGFEDLMIFNNPTFILCILTTIIVLVYLTIRVSFFYEIICDEDITAVEAIKKSFILTKGNVVRIILFNLYFIGLFFLCALVLVVLGMASPILILIFIIPFLIFIIFWLGPYVAVAESNLYRAIAFEKYGDENYNSYNNDSNNDSNNDINLE